MGKNPPNRVGFIGLGTMGYPMAGHLAQSGHSVTVFNRTAERAKEWQSIYGGQIADSPAKAAVNADAVIICVGDDDDVSKVVLGEQGVLKSLNSGAYLSSLCRTRIGDFKLKDAMSIKAFEDSMSSLNAPVNNV